MDERLLVALGHAAVARVQVDGVGVEAQRAEAEENWRGGREGYYVLWFLVDYFSCAISICDQGRYLTLTWVESQNSRFGLAVRDLRRPPAPSSALPVRKTSVRRSTTAGSPSILRTTSGPSTASSSPPTGP